MPALTAFTGLLANATTSFPSVAQSIYTQPFRVQQLGRGVPVLTPSPILPTAAVYPVGAVPVAGPTPMPGPALNKRGGLVKRQTVVQVVVVTVVTVVAAVVGATPTAITVTVPPPSNTVISGGGWPIINPGSAAACWSNTACNSVCPNFQQNGWYSGCVDAACTQCRCQIIQGSMCNGNAWTNATGYTNAAPQTVTIYGAQSPGAVATVTVVVGAGLSRWATTGVLWGLIVAVALSMIIARL